MNEKSLQHRHDYPRVMEIIEPGKSLQNGQSTLAAIADRAPTAGAAIVLTSFLGVAYSIVGGSPPADALPAHQDPVVTVGQQTPPHDRQPVSPRLGHVTVDEDDNSLSQIATREGADTEETAKASGLKDPDVIKRGDELTLVPKGTVVVSEGDNITNIPKLKGFTVQEVLASNSSIKDPDVIRVGQLIAIPPRRASSFAENNNHSGSRPVRPAIRASNPKPDAPKPPPPKPLPPKPSVTVQVQSPVARLTPHATIAAAPEVAEKPEVPDTAQSAPQPNATPDVAANLNKSVDDAASAAATTVFGLLPQNPLQPNNVSVQPVLPPASSPSAEAPVIEVPVISTDPAASPATTVTIPSPPVTETAPVPPSTPTSVPGAENNADPSGQPGVTLPPSPIEPILFIPPVPAGSEDITPASIEPVFGYSPPVPADMLPVLPNAEAPKPPQSEQLSGAIISTDIVKQMVPTPEGKANVDKNWPEVEAALKKDGITDPKVLAYTAATISVETSRFIPIREYASGWAYDILRNPKKAKELGNDQVGDGPTYRGGGVIQTTGKGNYRKCGEHIGVDLVNNPDLILDPKVSAGCAAFYIQTHLAGLLPKLERNDLKAARTVVNGGLNGYEPFRVAYLKGLALLEAKNTRSTNVDGQAPTPADSQPNTGLESQSDQELESPPAPSPIEPSFDDYTAPVPPDALNGLVPSIVAQLPIVSPPAPEAASPNQQNFTNPNVVGDFKAKVVDEQHNLIDLGTVEEANGIVTVLVNSPEVNGEKGGKTRVNIQIAIQLSDLYKAAALDGLKITGGGFRTREQQIERRIANCGSSQKQIYEVPASSCSPPTAKPGHSMHERGLAIDFADKDGNSLTSSSPIFSWLKANAHRFGLINLPSEPWHWSTTGS